MNKKDRLFFYSQAIGSMAKAAPNSLKICHIY